MHNNSIRSIRNYINKRREMSNDNKWNKDIHKLDTLFFNGQEQAFEEILDFLDGKYYIDSSGMVEVEKDEWDKHIRYFEFNDHEYYALLAVKESPVKSALDKSYEQYVKYVGGDNIEMIKEEGEPDELTKDEALVKFLRGQGHEKDVVGDIIDSFNKTEERPLLIDGGLL